MIPSALEQAHLQIEARRESDTADMVWGKLVTKDGRDYQIDDYRIEGKVVRILTAHEHKQIIIPFESMASIELGEPSGRERRLPSAEGA